MLKHKATLLVLIVFLFAASCKEKKNTGAINIVLPGNDSVIYYQGDQPGTAKLTRGKLDDSNFTAGMTTYLVNEGNTKTAILVKPLADISVTKDMMLLAIILNKEHITNYIVSNIDSTEKAYWNNGSFLDVAKYANPEVIKVEAPVSVSRQLPDGSPILFFKITKQNSLYYKYGSADLEKDMTLVNPLTAEAVADVITSLEKKYNTNFNNDSKILVKIDAPSKYAAFQKFKEGLKAKKYFKFSITTTQE